MDIKALALSANFELAAKQRFRYEGANGALTTEDLWRLPVKGGRNSLSLIAQTLSDLLPKKNELADFLSETCGESSSEFYTSERLAIVLYIISKKREEEHAAQEAQVRAAKRERIAEIIASKEDAKLASTDEDELRALLKALERRP